MRKALAFAGAALATCLGSGYFPLAPGTVGSILGAVAFAAAGPWRAHLLAPVIVLAWVGCFYGRRAWGRDPSRVNADEFAGCWVACLAAPASWGIWGLVSALVLFRVTDVLKPWPVSLLDRIDSPWGILLDDLAAGALSGAVLLAAGRLLPW